ncbi:MAG: hypothetical protein ACAI44_26575 [Candidatus Sericytochromatia bacterium]
MKYSETVSLARTEYCAGDLDELGLSRAYLTVLATACGRPLLDQAPEFEQIRDWSDYDYPKEEERYQWGDQEYGLRALTSGLFVRHGQRSGSIVFWVFLGLPAGLRLHGQSKLHPRWHSYARLDLEVEIEDAELAASLMTTFRQALQPWDLRQQPDGIAHEALESALTQLCWYGEPLSAEQAPPLQAAAAMVPAERPAGAALRYLLAILRMHAGELSAAASLLDPLAAIGENLSFSHGINLGFDANGRPSQIVWQDDFEPPAPFYEILLAQAWLAEQGDQPAMARKLYQRVANAKLVISADQARQRIKQLNKKPGA